MKNKAKIDAFVLSYKREENIPNVIQGLKRQSIVDKIYIYHNNPSKIKVLDAVNIYSEENFGCIVRHAMALLSDKEYVLFIDDDLELTVDFSSRFLKAISISPYSIIGLYGANINPKSSIDNLYLSGGDFLYSSFQRYVDIIKGRIHLTHRLNILDAFKFVIENRFKIKGLTRNDFIEDDIILNLASQIRTKVPAVLIPCKNIEIVELPAKYSLESQKNHYKNRSLLTSEFIKIGWRSFADKNKFYNENMKNGKKSYLVDELKSAIKFKKISKIKNIIKILTKERIPTLHLYNYAGILRDIKELSKAVNIYNYIISKGCKNDIKFKGLSLFQLGKITFNKNKKKQAVRYFKETLKIIPDHQLALQLLTKMEKTK